MIEEEIIQPEEILRIALLKILNMKELQLFAYLIHNFDIDIIDTDKIKKELDQQELTDKQKEMILNKLTAKAWYNSAMRPRITFYKDFLINKGVNGTILILLHEILHLLDHDCLMFYHDENPELMNLAMDDRINITIKKSIHNKEMPNTITWDDEGSFYIPELENKNMTKREVYEWLLNKIQSSTCICNFTGSDGESQEVKEIDLGTDSNGKKRKLLAIADLGKPKDGDAEKVKGKTEELKAKARAVNDLLRQQKRGLISGYMSDAIDKLIEIIIPWERVVMKAIANKVVPKKDNRSWRSLQKRMYVHGITLPDHDFHLKRHLLIETEDTSGSISSDDLKKWGSLTKQASNFFDEIWIFKHDVAVQSLEKIKSSHFNEDDVLYKYKGRGGTSHKPVFDEIEKIWKDNTYKISMVLIVTDFYSDIEKIWNDYEWHKHIPLKIILNQKNKVPTHIDDSPVIIQDYK